MFPKVLRFSIQTPINDFIQDLVTNYGFVFRNISGVILRALLGVEWLFRGLPWWVVIPAFMVLGWFSSRRISFTILVGILFFVVGMLGLWDLTMQTLSLMVMASLAAVIVGVPIGVMLAQFRMLRSVTLPILDVMQTMPSFVYLIPAMMLFGLGKVPAILATVKLPSIYLSKRSQWHELNDHYVFKSYFDILMKYAFKAKEPVIHPALRRPDVFQGAPSQSCAEYRPATSSQVGTGQGR